MRLRWLIAATVLALGMSSVTQPASASVTEDGTPELPAYQKLSQASPAYFPPPGAGCDPALTALGGSCVTDGSAAVPLEAAAEEVRLQGTTVPSVQGPVSIVPLPERRHRPAGGYLVVHQDGDVSLLAAGGSRTWHRPGASLHTDWGVARPTVLPQLRSGYDAFDPFNRVSSRPYTYGSLTRAGVEHLAVAHFVRWAEPNVGFRYSSFVTVFDVATGDAVWAGFYPGAVTQLLIHDGMLVVGHETGDPSGPAENEPEGEADTRTVLTGLRFSGRRTLTAEAAWSYSTGAEWARWLAVEPAGPGALVAAWTANRPGSGGQEYGHVLRFDVATGARTWEVATDAYPRLVRYDAGRDRVVVLGQADPTAAWSYTLRALRGVDGTAAGSTVTRSAAVPFALEVADVDGQPGAEWVTSDATMTSADPAIGTMAGGTVIAARGDDGGMLWRADASRPAPDAGPARAPIAPHPYGLAVQQGVVLVATYFPGTEPSPLFIRRYTGRSELRALSGRNGTVRWHREGDVATPLALVPYQVGGEAAVLTGTGHLVLHAYSLGDGATVRTTPLLAEVTAAETLDVNRDGTTDLVVGGQSEAVFALDGRTLGSNPAVLWVKPVAGEVHEIHAVTLPGGERRLVVVAATAMATDGNRAYPRTVKSGVDVLAADTGARRYRIPMLPDFAWTAEVTELGGVPAILVPSRTLTAYRVTDGARLWRFDPTAGTSVAEPVMNPVHFSNPVVTSDGKVAVEYFVKAAVDTAGQRIQPTTTPDNHTAAVLDGATGEPVWQVPVASPGKPQLWRGVAGEVATAAGTPGVAFAHHVTQWGAPTRTQVDVYDLNTGVLSHSALLDRYYHYGVAALPISGLVTWGGIFELVSISPEGHVSRRMSPPPHDVAEARSARFGDVLVTATRIGWLGVFDPNPTEAGFTRLARSGDIEARGGSVLVRDLDGDGSDEILHYSYDLPADNATQNMYGAFSMQFGLSTPKGLTVYSLG